MPPEKSPPHLFKAEREQHQKIARSETSPEGPTRSTAEPDHLAMGHDEYIAAYMAQLRQFDGEGMLERMNHTAECWACRAVWIVMFSLAGLLFFAGVGWIAVELFGGVKWPK